MDYKLPRRNISLSNVQSELLCEVGLANTKHNGKKMTSHFKCPLLKYNICVSGKGSFDIDDDELDGCKAPPHVAHGEGLG